VRRRGVDGWLNVCFDYFFFQLVQALQGPHASD
jgi:hypothetical protein